VSWDEGGAEKHLALGLLAKNPFQFCDQRREILRYGIPDLVQIEVKVHVHQSVSHGDDLGPGNLGNLRILAPSLRPDTPGGLADDLNALDQPQCPDAVAIQLGPGSPLRGMYRLAGRIQHVL
jgi:hypothetical protein